MGFNENRVWWNGLDRHFDLLYIGRYRAGAIATQPR